MNITEKDLMVGDWVQYGDIHPIKTRVLAISSVDNGKHWHIQVEPESQNSIRIVAMHAVEPIDLTAEILKKIGFGYVENDVNLYDGKVLSHFYLGDECFCANMDLHICTYNDGIFWFSSPKLTLNGIRYLHELQHAMRLAGIDKEITI